MQKQEPAKQPDSIHHLFDPENPLALGTRLPKRLSEVLLKLLLSEPAVTALIGDEEALLKYLNKIKGYQPTVTDNRIRLLMWQDFEHSITEGRHMIPCNFHSLVCSEKLFSKLFLTQPHRAAFLLCRPVAYEVAIKEGLMHGMKRMREILDLPETDPVTGRISTKILELKLKITAMMDMRLHGAPKQSIQQLNVHVDATKAGVNREVRALVEKGDINTIRKRIHEIEQQNKTLNGAAEQAGEAALVPELVPARHSEHK